MPELLLYAAAAVQHHAAGRDLPLPIPLRLAAGWRVAHLVTLQPPLLLQLAAHPAAHSSGGCSRVRSEVLVEAAERQRMVEREQIC